MLSLCKVELEVGLLRLRRVGEVFAAEPDGLEQLFALGVGQQFISDALRSEARDVWLSREKLVRLVAQAKRCMRAQIAQTRIVVTDRAHTLLVLDVPDPIPSMLAVAQSPYGLLWLRIISGGSETDEQLSQSLFRVGVSDDSLASASQPESEQNRKRFVGRSLAVLPEDGLALYFSH